MVIPSNQNNNNFSGCYNQQNNINVIEFCEK